MFPKNPQMETLFHEMRIFGSRIGSVRSILLHLALVVAFGIWIPRLKGVDFLDTQVLGAYACLGLIFAAPATAQAFPEAFSTSFQQAKARIFVSVLYGEIVVLALLGTGIATVYLTHRGGFVPSPDWQTLAKCATFGLGASTMLASLAAWTTLRFSRRIAIICIRLAFFALLILFYYQGQMLPDVGLTGAAACLIVAGLAIELLRRACK
jgi:hypothetical protein